MPNDDGNPAAALSFAADVKPLFRDRDRAAMLKAFDLWSYDDVRAHAADIEEKVRAGSMPCDGAWPADWVALFARWRAEGTAP